MCGREDENSLHALLFHPLAMEVWRLSSYGEMNRERDGSIGDWWEKCFDRIEDEEMCVILTIAWAIWGARCKEMMEHPRGKPADILAYALKTSKEAFEVIPTH